MAISITTAGDIEVPLGTMPDAAPAMSALNNLESKVVEKQQQLSQPIAHSFELVLNP